MKNPKILAAVGILLILCVQATQVVYFIHRSNEQQQRTQQLDEIQRRIEALESNLRNIPAQTQSAK